ncbi:MAG: GNAT family N-acetyltransferase, partial [Bacteroidota bacterium]
MTIDWNVKKFDELTPHELYAVLQLRNEVFVVEQNCVFQDADDKDQVAFHFMGWSDKKLLAYTRLLGPGTTYPEASIGRVVSSPLARGSGIGKELMQKSIEAIYKIYGRQNIQIGACRLGARGLGRDGAHIALAADLLAQQRRLDGSGPGLRRGRQQGQIGLLEAAR